MQTSEVIGLNRMNYLRPALQNERAVKVFLLLVAFHIFIIALSNYLVQIPFTLYGVHSTWGAFSFPFIFVATDLTVRLYGAALARRIIFAVMLPALVVSYVVSTLFFETSWQSWMALTQFNSFVFRIAVASFMAYALGQLLDVQVFNRLRQIRFWWLAPAASMIVGNAMDTLAFFSIAFYRSTDEFMATHWPEIALVDYAVKIFVCILFFLPIYGVMLRYILQKLQQKAAAK